MKTEPNEPIRVNGGAWNDESQHTHAGRGLTKREYFAAMAMQGILACSEGGTFESVKEFAVKHADALIAELNKEKK
jgi:hypothetical protein